MTPQKTPKTIIVALALVSLAVPSALRGGEDKIWNAPTEKIYGQLLLDEVAANNPNVTLAALHVVPEGGKANVIIASTLPNRVGFESNDTLDVWPIEAKFAIAVPSKTKDLFEVYAPLQDMHDNIVGCIVLKVKWQRGTPHDVPFQQAMAIVDGLKPKIQSSHALFRLPLVYTPPGRTFAQQLVDETAAKYNLKLLAFHCTPPGAALNCNIASTLKGRVGNRSGKYDNMVAEEKMEVVENAPDEKAFEICLPMYDRERRLLGGASIIFHLDPSISAQKYYQDAVKIRDEIGQKVPSSAALYEVVQ